MIYRMPVVGILFCFIGAPPGLTALLGKYIRSSEIPVTSGNIRHVMIYRIPVVGIFFNCIEAPPGRTALLGNYIQGSDIQ